MAVVEYEVKSRTAYIVLNRPDKLNAINTEVLEALHRAMDDFRQNPDAWVAILSGTGRAFCTGADTTEVSSERMQVRRVEEMYLLMLDICKPIITAVHGFCLGQGCGLALCSDIVIAAQGCKFGWPHAKIGLTSISGPSLGIDQIPNKILMELMFTARLIDCDEALRLNIVNHTVPQGELMSKAERITKEILMNSPDAIRSIKAAVILGRNRSIKEKLDISADKFRSVKPAYHCPENR